MKVWIIYESQEFPGQVLARPFALAPGQLEPIEGETVIAGPSVKAVRGRLPPGLTLLNPTPDDDPSIREVWL